MTKTKKTRVKETRANRLNNMEEPVQNDRRDKSFQCLDAGVKREQTTFIVMLKHNLRRQVRSDALSSP